MSPDAELLVIFGVLHLVALVLGGALFVDVPAFRRRVLVVARRRGRLRRRRQRPRLDKPKTSPPGGIPLPFAVQSDERLRSGHDKLADPAGRRRANAQDARSRRGPTRRRGSASR